MRFVVRLAQPGDGAVVEETAEAASESEVRERYRAKGRWVLDLRRLAPALPGAPSSGRQLDVAWWCRELRTLLNAGMTAVEAIETLAAGRHDAVRVQVHEALLRGLREGQSLSRAMGGTGVFPEVLVASVTASERTGTLPAALEDYLRYDEMIERLRRQVISAAIYPAVVVTLGLLISGFLLLYVVPRFTRMYADVHNSLSPVTTFVLWLSRLLREQMPFVVSFLAALALLCLMAWRSGWLARIALLSIESVAPLREQWDQFRLAKLYQALALMFKGGYTFDEALDVGRQLDLGTRLNIGLDLARHEIARGRAASLAMSAGGLTEVTTERLLAVGERTGGFANVLQTIADRHVQRFETFVERATRVVEPLLLLMVALAVGGIVVMMYMPIFDIAGGLGGVR